MIDVVLSNGDRAEADTGAAAIFAARTLLEEAAAPLGAAAIRRLSASFLVGGRVVLGQVGYGCVLSLRALPGVCSVCDRIIEPGVRFRTAAGAPVHMLCDDGDVPSAAEVMERDG